MRSEDRIMWKKGLDIYPGEWVSVLEHKIEFGKELRIGDQAKVIVDSQFQDEYDNGEKLPRRFLQIGEVIKIDEGDEWAYNLLFQDGKTNWFKRYILEKYD